MTSSGLHKYCSHEHIHIQLKLKINTLKRIIINTKVRILETFYCPPLHRQKMMAVIGHQYSEKNNFSSRREGYTECLKGCRVLISNRTNPPLFWDIPFFATTCSQSMQVKWTDTATRARWEPECHAWGSKRLHDPLSTDHLTMLIAFWECGTYSWTALAMERAVDPVSLTLSKVTFGRSSSSLSLLLCLGDRPRGSICAGKKRHI